MSENRTKQPSAGEVLERRIAEMREHHEGVKKRAYDRMKEAGDVPVKAYYAKMFDTHSIIAGELEELAALATIPDSGLSGMPAIPGKPTPDRSDRFASEMLHFESIKEAEQAHDAHRRAMRDERRTRFERRIREALERNWQAWPLATPHGVAGYLADALCPPTEAGEAP